MGKTLLALAILASGISFIALPVHYKYCRNGGPEISTLRFATRTGSDSQQVAALQAQKAFCGALSKTVLR
jgi:hypothetical protein